MTSMPASRKARAMTFAPRSWPSKPGLATSTRMRGSIRFDGSRIVLARLLMRVGNLELRLGLKKEGGFWKRSACAGRLDFHRGGLFELPAVRGRDNLYLLRRALGLRLGSVDEVCGDANGAAGAGQLPGLGIHGYLSDSLGRLEGLGIAILFVACCLGHKLGPDGQRRSRAFQSQIRIIVEAHP